MPTSSDIAIGGLIRRTLLQEADAIRHLAESLDERFDAAVRAIVDCPGRVITCGIGKSGHIARKTAGTLSSTGTPSHFLNAAEAVHGDLGTIQSGDIVLMYSHSGETDELVRLFPSIAAIGGQTILITGRPQSSAGRLASIVLDTRVTAEACPNNLAPTTSTTVMLALSDALALAVMELRGFTAEDFARYHPSGALGRRLTLTVRDVMRQGPDLATVGPDAPLHETMRAITSAGAGAACVVEDGRLVGFISDGDLRRGILNGLHLDTPSRELMTTQTSTFPPDLMAVEALEAFQNHPKKIGEMPVVEGDGRLVGLLMLKDLLRSGIV